MHTLVLVVLIACGSTLAHYNDYQSRNAIEKEEPLNGEIVECPVCDDSGQWIPSNEKCITKGNKRYKHCLLGTYINEVCGNRRDCYRGAGEQCTEKRDFDNYGQKCAPGYYCSKPLGICVGQEYVVDTKLLYTLNRTPYSMGQSALKSGTLSEYPFIRRD